MTPRPDKGGGGVLAVLGRAANDLRDSAREFPNTFTFAEDAALLERLREALADVGGEGSAAGGYLYCKETATVLYDHDYPDEAGCEECPACRLAALLEEDANA